MTTCAASSDPDVETLVIGAGLAGLSCAVRLHESGHQVLVLEASDKVGGRLRTDVVDGFLLDRGFQVFLDAYPEARQFLDLEALDLQSFDPGALVWKRGKQHPVMDVFRRPDALFSSALAPVGSFTDKLLVAKLRWHLMRKPLKEIWASPEQSTAAYLEAFGFSARMVDEFFRSFYGGIFLEDQLETSSRIFQFTFKMFALGSATLPAKGMQAIPEHLASRLPDDAIRLRCPVDSVEGMSVSTQNGIIRVGQLVVAVDGESAHRLLPGLPRPGWNSTVCLHYAADEAPINQPIIALKGDRSGLINNVCVPSEVASGYAPAGKSLVCVSILGDHKADAAFEQRIRGELVEWFGSQSADWQLLKMETIRKALPVGPPGHGVTHDDQPPVFHCGDFTTSGSIEGAIISGLRAADRILAKV
ncbi:NAD(P)/FAD-dependent oxidoreductase [Haloferula sp.]|uniref:NAD(P)/FAD-dependent oxidoreductase n=1 Tax=Haloferula sp. TaxID=2497595 RepID=UPI00329FD10C